MTNKSKQKGNRYEKELVEAFKIRGFRAERAWGSNGRALGHGEEVDVLVERQIRIQAKIRKALPKYLRLSDDIDVVACRQDHGKTVIMCDFEYFLELLERAGYATGHKGA